MKNTNFKRLGNDLFYKEYQFWLFLWHVNHDFSVFSLMRKIHQLKYSHFKFWINRFSICYLPPLFGFLTYYKEAKILQNLHKRIEIHYISRMQKNFPNLRIFEWFSFHLRKCKHFKFFKYEFQTKNQSYIFFVSWKIIVIVVRSLISLTTWWLDFHAHVAHR